MTMMLRPEENTLKPTYSSLNLQKGNTGQNMFMGCRPVNGKRCQCSPVPRLFTGYRFYGEFQNQHSCQNCFIIGEFHLSVVFTHDQIKSRYFGLFVFQDFNCTLSHYRTVPG